MHARLRVRAPARICVHARARTLSCVRAHVFACTRAPSLGPLDLQDQRVGPIEMEPSAGHNYIGP